MTSSLLTQLLDFIKASPTPFHATQITANRLNAAGFKAIDEASAWTLQKGRYFVTRNDSSIIAFNYDPDSLPNTGFKMVGAHTDSPCLKVKPNPVFECKGYQQIAVEVYGGVLLNPWFDRDLSLAGKVTYKCLDGQLRSALIDFEVPVATIPSLAIHLDREANNARTVNPQTDLPPIVAQVDFDFHHQLIEQVKRCHSDAQIETILAFDLSFYDTQAPRLTGLHSDFIASARLDNLLSCFLALEALISSPQAPNAMIIFNDHEEVGSASYAGADGSFLVDVIDRLTPSSESKIRSLAASMLISTDNAHGVHPNFSAKHEPRHGPKLNGGPVIKINANQRYATNADTHAIFKSLCEDKGIPHQVFVTRSDMGCGSTIGPITASKLGIKTLDVGLPTFGMHSIRELAGAQDAQHLVDVLTAFYQSPGPSIVPGET